MKARRRSAATPSKRNATCSRGSRTMRAERALKDGAIPAKYKILMTMIVDAIQAHPEGVANIANRARAAGATEAEINETVEVVYLFGGTPALVTAVNAFRSA